MSLHLYKSVRYWIYWKYIFIFCLVVFGAWFFSPSSPVFYSKTDHEKPTGFNDFLFYYGVSKIADSGNMDKIYDSDLQQENISQIINFPVLKQLPYLYPPQSLLFFSPLAKFTLSQSFIIWQVINIAVTLLLIRLLYVAGICKNNSKSLFIATILILSSYPWVSTIIQGQVVILMVVGLLAYQIFAKHKRMYWVAGILIALTAFKPPLFIAPVLYLLIIYGKELFYATLTASIFVVAVCSYLFGFTIWTSYLDIMLVASGETEFGASLLSMCNIRSMIFILAGKTYLPIINIISSLLMVMGIFMVAYLAFVLKNRSDKMLELGFALSIAITCLFSPWLHIYSLFLLVIPVGYLLKYTKLEPSYLYIGIFIIFNFLTMITGSALPWLNSFIWVTVQVLLVGFLIHILWVENNKFQAINAVS